MTIISFKPNHDGSLAYLRDGELVFSYECEDDSRPRHSHVNPTDWLTALENLPEPPDAIAVGGWHLDSFAAAYPTALDQCLNYRGEKSVGSRVYSIFGRPITLFMSTHERSHLMCSFGLSDLPQGEPCYALVWEGRVGTFYRSDGKKWTVIGSPLDSPGLRYSYLYYLADTRQTNFRHPSNASGPGKLMALASFGRVRPLDADETALLDYFFSEESVRHITNPGIIKDNLPFRTPFSNIGVETQRFKDIVRAFSDRMFDCFYRFARAYLTEHLPLVVGGGCGLNCEWNTRWRESGLFSHVFVPPCVDDSGSAIGTALDAQFHLTGNAKLKWNVYAGRPFQIDCEIPTVFSAEPLDFEVVATLLSEGHIIPWAHGRAEIGPRALGNRSLLAEPFTAGTARRLNEIKQREQFRPVAAVCLEEDIGLHLSDARPTPYMLYFQYVTAPLLQAVTHVDGTTRAQSVNERQNANLHRLLVEFKRQSGAGVLCNTSLNLKGCGFINSLSELFKFVTDKGLRYAVAEGRLYRVRRIA